MSIPLLQALEFVLSIRPRHDEPAGTEPSFADNRSTGAVVSSLSLTSGWDSEAVDSSVYIGDAMQWWHSRQWSYQTNYGPPISIFVHDLTMTGGNAAWDPNVDVFRIGDPIAGETRPTAAGLDFMAHETWHAVDGTTLHLAGQGGEPAAPDESLGDSFGNMIESDVEPTAYASTPAFEGEALLVAPASSVTFVRDLQVPHNSEPAEPDNVNDPLYNVGNDPHVNCGVPSNAWYLATFGGPNITSRISVPTSTAMGVATAELVYSVTAETGVAVTSFYDFSEALLGVTKVLFGGSQLSAVACAWYATGVLQPEELLNTWNVTSCPCAQVADGAYCGNDGVVGKASTLYRCAGQMLQEASPCANGCEANGNGTDTCTGGTTGGGGGTSSSGPCTLEPQGNDCGKDGFTLYQCGSSGNVLGSQYCPAGCQVVGSGQDTCGGQCPSPSGSYCGGDGVVGDPNTLYSCSMGVAHPSTVCPNGCQSNGGGADACATAVSPCSGQPAGTTCSADGTLLYVCNGSGNLQSQSSCARGCSHNGNGDDSCNGGAGGLEGSCQGLPDGLYCGNDAVGADLNTLYQCIGGQFGNGGAPCPFGCQISGTGASSGGNDFCAGGPDGNDASAGGSRCNGQSIGSVSAQAKPRNSGRRRPKVALAAGGG